MRAKYPRESLAVVTDIILPGETNPINNLFGGDLLARMDRIASISAGRHCRRHVVTASVNHVAFQKPIPLGSIITIEAKVSRAFKTSMEVYIEVFMEDRINGEKTRVNDAIYTFVAVDEYGSPVQVPELKPETALEKERYNAALRRRELSLVLAGKMAPKDAVNLKSIFLGETAEK